MTKQDQTSKADDQKVKPDDETAKADKTAEKEKKEQKPLVDYESKFKASQDEALKLKSSLEDLQGRWDKIAPILQILNDNPELMQQVDEVYTGSSTKRLSATQTQIVDALVKKKVEDEIRPLAQEVEFDRKQRVERAFSEFNKKFPDAMQHWDKIERNLKAMKAAGYPLEEGLENAYLLAKKDEAVKQGKKEMAFEIYRRDQAAAGGGAAAGTSSGKEAMTAEELKVAHKLGVKAEEYAKEKEDMAA